MFHWCDNHRLEVFRRLKGIKVIDHLTQVEDHAINRQLRQPARRIGKGHLLPSALFDHRESKASLFGGIGDTVKVVKLHGEGPVKRRIMDMGITKGTEVFIRKVAPLGDPMEVTVRGYELSLRKADTEMIEIA